MSGGRPSSLARRIRRALAWSFVNTLVLRLGNLVLGMVLARLLVPEEFGVFAIALTVQAILMTLADLGLSADLIRAENPELRAPTVATLSLVSGIGLALAMTLSAGAVASVMQAPDASGVIAVLAWTLVLSGAGVVPYAKLQREFAQGKLFACSVIDFAVYTSVTIALVLLGLGPMALALARVGAQLASTSAQFMLARVRPHFGFNRPIARSALAFGLPLAGANLLSWALLSFDNMAIARIAGASMLGLYVLAFNVSTWPMSAIGQAVRSVSLPGFSEASREADDREDPLVTVLALTWAAALPVGVLLAALAHPLIVLLYGARWSASATVLAALGIFGALRVAFDLAATYLMANGAARPVLYVQVVWFAALVPAVVVATHRWGIAGAGWAHLVVAIGVVVPAYAVALARVGVSMAALARVLWPPLAAAVPAWWLGHAVAGAIDAPLVAVLLGGAAGCAAYALVSYRWVRSLLPARGSAAEPPAQRVDEPLLGGVPS